MASAGWVGEIDFIGIDGDDSGVVDVGPKGPSPGDFFVVDQEVEVIGLSHGQGTLQLGAGGTFKGILSFVTPNLVRANVTIKLAAGWIRISGWLNPAIFDGGGPASTLLLAKGNGGIFTGSRGYFMVFPIATTGIPTESRPVPTSNPTSPSSSASRFRQRSDGGVSRSSLVSAVISSWE